MKELMEVIKERKLKLEQSNLSQSMQDKNISVEERMSFIPSMLFFVMGFKDILDELEDKSVNDKIQDKVNQHCLEDEGHWRWFLNDLKRLKFDNSYLSQSQTQAYELLWSDSYKPMRDIIYQTMHYSKLSQTIPGSKLVIIEVLEAAFAAFLLNMHKLIKEAGLFDELEYFGQTHQDQEDAHSIGSWLDEDLQKAKLEDDIPAEHLALTHNIVNDLFDYFDKMFDCWHKKQKGSSLAA